MISEFIFLYILLLACIMGLLAAIRRNWWPLIICNTLLLFPVGDRLLTCVAVMLGLAVAK